MTTRTPLRPADDAFLARLAAHLPEGALRPPEARHLAEPRGRWQGQAAALVLPRTTDEVAATVRLCAEAGVGIVPYSGGTGLVGGQIAAGGPVPILIGFDRMAAIRSADAIEAVLVAEAGAILADVQAAAADAGMLFPLSLASEGSARLGGLLATNAGGVNVLRWGNMRDLCLGVEAVMADGSVLRGLKRLRKDNAGYDLRHLLIGSEGTLGIITAAALRLVPAPGAQAAAMIAVRDPEAALALLRIAQEEASGMVSAFEIMHRCGFDFIARTMPDLRLPFADPPEWSVLIEIGTPATLDPEALMLAVFERGMAAGLARDGVLAASAAQRADLWAVREGIPEANRRIGAVSSHDISVPLGAIPDFIRAGGAALARIDDFRVNCFGHLGDGNLHYNVFPRDGRTRADHEHQRAEIKRALHDIAHAMGGSVAAEHGVGRLKVGDLERYGDPAKLAAMRAIKDALDPRGILNPGAVLRAPAVQEPPPAA